jgi:hypothetical protein
VKIKTLYNYCEQVGRRGKDYAMKQFWKVKPGEIRTAMKPSTITVVYIEQFSVDSDVTEIY